MSKESYYDVLGLDKKFTDTDLKKRFRILSIKYHPDKNKGDPKAKEMFQKVARAKEVLSDPEKREAYDKYGEEGLKLMERGEDPRMAGMGRMGGFPGGFPDGFADIFGGMGMGMPHRRRQRRQPKVVRVKVTLSECYRGTEKNIDIKTKKLCYDCLGKGAKNLQNCKECNGKGIKVVDRQVRPGMIQRSQRECEKCYGKGKIFKPSDRCGGCKGTGFIENVRNILFKIEPGADNKDHKEFPGKGDEDEDGKKGDLVLVIECVESPRFTRHGNDLIYQMEIDLVDALVGVNYVINNHPSGKKLRVNDNRVLNPDSYHKIDNMGMPYPKSDKKGDLFVLYKIVFPKKLDQKVKSNLKKIMQPTPIPSATAGELTPNCGYGENLSRESFVNKEFEGREPDDMDDMGSGVQCAQQ